MANIYSVGQLNTSIKRLIAQDPMLGLVYVKGEISNLTYHRTGHIYFTLKDESSSISAIMFASSKSKLNFVLKEGMEVVVEGRVDYYEVTGKCSLIASRIKQEGIGALAEKFEALKQKLMEMGMFDSGYKRPIPKYIKKLGVVTAPTGAAVRDIINVSKRRNPGIEIILYPAIVQGESAPESIIKGIKLLDNYGVDVMIVGRGGGSMEDLFCFNDEELAHAIFECETPIISAVGHETDFTIADFVSDLRAPTPSAAAELAVTDMLSVVKGLEYYDNRLNAAVERVINDRKSAVQNRLLKLKALSPESKLKDRKQHLTDIKNGLNNAMDAKLSEKKHMMSIYLERLKGLSPLDKLSQGYSFVADEKGSTINSIENINEGDTVNIYVKDGEINAVVKGKQFVDRIGDADGREE